MLRAEQLPGMVPPPFRWLSGAAALDHFLVIVAVSAGPLTPRCLDWQNRLARWHDSVGAGAYYRRLAAPPVQMSALRIHARVLVKMGNLVALVLCQVALLGYVSRSKKSSRQTG
jgi:hypothetical protein